MPLEDSNSRRVWAVLRVTLRAALFYAGFNLILGELLSLNFLLAPNTPWALFVAPILLIVWIKTLGRRWSPFALNTSPKPTSFAAGYVLSSSLTCMAIFVLQGAVFSVTAEPLRLSNEASQAMAIGYALVVPPLGALLEEVSFRGVLQGGLQAIFGTKAAAWIAGAVFVLSHCWKPEFIPLLGLYVAIAFFTAAAAARTQSIVLGVLIHVMVNTVSGWSPIFLGPLPLGRLPIWSALTILVAGVVTLAGAVWTLKCLQCPPDSKG